MSIVEAVWAGVPVSITDGFHQVQFDTPSDFADWMYDHSLADIRKFRWVTAPVLSDS